MKQKNLLTFIDILIVLLSIALAAGVRLVFHACAPKEDGTWMVCHWAERAVWTFACAILLQSVILLFYRGRGANGVKAGLGVAIAIQAFLCSLLPGHMISLCMMDTMRCHTVMKPAVGVCCLLLTLSALAGCVLHGRRRGT